MFSSIKTITVRSRLLTASLCFPQWRIIILLSSSYFVLVKSLNGAVSLVRDFPAVFSDVTFCLFFFLLETRILVLKQEFKMQIVIHLSRGMT